MLPLIRILSSDTSMYKVATTNIARILAQIWITRSAGRLCMCVRDVFALRNVEVKKNGSKSEDKYVTEEAK